MDYPGLFWVSTEKDERHERHRAGLLDEVQGEVKIQAGG